MCVVGIIMAYQVQDGRCGAYNIEYDCYDYYVVKWYGTPWEARKYFFCLSEEEFEVHKGEMVCKGLCFDKRPSTTKW